MQYDPSEPDWFSWTYMYGTPIVPPEDPQLRIRDGPFSCRIGSSSLVKCVGKPTLVSIKVSRSSCGTSARGTYCGCVFTPPTLLTSIFSGSQILLKASRLIASTNREFARQLFHLLRDNFIASLLQLRGIRHNYLDGSFRMKLQ